MRSILGIEIYCCREVDMLSKACVIIKRLVDMGEIIDDILSRERFVYSDIYGFLRCVYIIDVNSHLVTPYD